MTSDRSITELLFTGKGEMAELMRSLDWSQTSFGTVETWSQSLRSTLSICLNSRFPIAIYWGKDSLLLYNDAWRPIVGDKHPWALGRSAREVWAEIWETIGPELNDVMQTGEGIFHKDEALFMRRFGYLEEAFFEYTFNPVRGEGGTVGGSLNIVSETTYRVLNDRRAELLREVASKTGLARTAEEACSLMAETLRSDPLDIPFAQLYLTEDDQARLCGSTERDIDHTISPETLDLGKNDRWSIGFVAQTGERRIITDLETRFGNIPGSPWPEVPQEAVILPITPAGQTKVAGVLVAVASPRRRLDDRYHDFLEQIAAQIGMAIANARSYEEERRRAEELAAIDRAKTAFFSNVSHEFRTPLTLMLSPLEDLTTTLDNRLQSDEREQLHLIQRNGLRLQKLVNTLLDFSRIEAGRVQAVYEPTDLAAFTAELASVFRSLVERSGLHLQIDCPELSEPVYVDRDMWEKIVLNLISNAFKFTFEGSITVQLKPIDQAVELSVTDTGSGIPEAELPKLFERFHRVNGAKSRTYEGSGIGLALVQELVKLHGGTIRVSSQVDRGTTFTIDIPFGTDHLPSDRIQSTRTLESTAFGAAPFVEEAMRWIPESNLQLPALDFKVEESTAPFTAATINPVSSAKILLADDNADMRDYVKRLLSSRFEVQTVANGVEALIAIQDSPPDLVLTDVMMPELDGFGLLRSLRTHPSTQDIPIIMLSARAGEEARIEGLEAGADDYLTKPFSARELLARIEATLKLSKLRQEAFQREQTLRLSSETAQAEAEAAGRRNEQLLESMSDAFVALDRDWRILYQNAAAERINDNKPRSEVIGKTLWEEWPASVGSIADRNYRYALEHQVPVQFEQHYYEPPDHDVWLEVRAYPFEEGLGIFYCDISDRKRIELERERLLEVEQSARETAETANRIKDEFLAVLSHELRSPLNPILGWSKLLQQGRLDAAKTAQALSTIERNAQLQSQLINDLLDISRILRGKLALEVTPVDVATVITAAIETVRLAAEAKSIQLKTDFSPQVSVLGDSGRLQQVVWNLLSNAVKFTPAGGEVSIVLSQTPTHAQIQVTDTGRGISHDFLPLVFERFRQEDGTTTRKFGGLGLGLAIARQITELHGGTITVASAGEDQGATFTVQIPLATRSTIQPPEPPVLIQDLNNLKILVVDDERDSREFVVFVLEQAGAIVTSAASGLAALQAIEQSMPDLIVSDIGMPEMDGYMLMQQIRLHAQKLPAIALTAYTGEFNQAAAIEAGFAKHIAKPVDPDLLIQTVAALVNPDKVLTSRSQARN